MTRSASQRHKTTGGHVPTWPFVCIVVCLFVISVVAMRNWERPAAHHVSLDDTASKVLDAASKGTSNKTGTAVRNARPSGRGSAFPAAADAGNHSASNARNAILKGSDAVVTKQGARPAVAPPAAPPADAANEGTSDVPSFPAAIVDLPVGASSDPDATTSDDYVELDVATDGQGDDDPAVADDTQGAAIGDGSSATTSAAGETDSLITDSPRRFRPVDACWPYPESLVAQLEAAAESPHCRDWALSMLDELDRLAAVPTLDSPEAQDVLDRVNVLAPNAGRLASSCPEDVVRVALQRLEYAWERRIGVWSQAHATAAAASVRVEVHAVDSPEISVALSEVEAILGQFSPSEGWREYLLLNELNRLADTDVAESGGSLRRNATGAMGDAAAILDDGGLPTVAVSTEAATLVAERRAVARRLLKRLEASSLTVEQEDFLSQPAFAKLNRALRHWSDEPVDVAALLAALERYEASGTTQAGREALHAVSILRWSPDETAVQLARSVEQYYRNANVRIAVSEGLLNRLIPQPDVTVEDVDDHVAGANVRGVSENHTRLFLRLLPDRDRIRVGLEAKGVVASETEAWKGAATVYNDGLSQFHARKLVQVDRKGVRLWRSEAEAESDTQMTDLATDFDGMPVFSALARMIAMKQHSQLAPQARWEIQEKIAARARQKLDDEVNRRVAKAERQFQEQVMEPLRRLDIAPEVVDMQTTSQRIIVRSRLASTQQLAAFTPRPLAPGSCLVSAQIHESVFNNLLDQLELDGRRVPLDDLYRELAARAGHPEVEIPQDLPENITVQFAEHDAIHVRCDDGKLQLTIRLAELSQGRGSTWRNFEVRGYYYPQITGIDARLVRDGYVELVGERLGIRDQVALRGIFTKVLSKRTELRLVPDSIVNDARFHDLNMHQFVIQDGWIGVAIGAGKSSVPSNVASSGPVNVAANVPGSAASRAPASVASGMAGANSATGRAR